MSFTSKSAGYFPVFDFSYEQQETWERKSSGSQFDCLVAKDNFFRDLNHDFYEIALRLCGGQSFARSLHATHLLNETFLRL
ncbi:MAG: hypothetical protein AAGA30_03780, partial [Planctomycetota bacterium]